MRLSLVSDWDGYLPDPEPGEDASTLLAQLENTSEEALVEEVYLERAYTLCPPCRNHLAKDPLQRGERVGPGGRLQ